MGTGPFVFERWQRGSHVLLKRNPAYWAAGRPLLDQVVFKFVPDRAAATAELESGGVDVAALQPSDVDRIAKIPRLQVELRDDGYLNGMQTLEFNLDQPPLADLRVRQAIAHAVDKEFIRKAIFAGRAEVVDSPVPKVLAAYYAPARQTYRFDPAEAERLLDAAGWPRKGGARGERFALVITHYPTNTGARNTAGYVRAALARVGIRATVQDADLPLFVRRVYAERQFGININAVGMLYDPTVGVQRHYVWARPADKGVAMINAAGYTNPEAVDLFRRIAEEADDGRRAALLHRLQDLLAEEIPLLPLVSGGGAVAWSRRVHGYYNSIDLSAGDLSGAWVERR
ncbi:MAG: Glutathione-binding protein GsiB [Burkholderia gladioli]|nr:MAG: Glutathione-binding protein GsiB [Burkholderia gladioli]